MSLSLRCSAKYLWVKSSNAWDSVQNYMGRGSECGYRWSRTGHVLELLGLDYGFIGVHYIILSIFAYVLNYP